MSIRVTVSLEQRFDRTLDGRVWATGGFNSSFWDAYLQVFDSVRVLARVRDVVAPPERAVVASGPGVSFAAMPYYVGAVQHLARLPAVIQAVHAHARADDAYILRVPSVLAVYLAPLLERRHHPYSVEVVGDPFDVFAPGMVEDPLRPFVRRWMTSRLRRQCRAASAGSYVTENALQSRYPCSGPTFSISSIRLERDAIVSTPRVFDGPATRLVFVGTLERLYKAPDVLLEAVARTVAAGRDLTLTVIGDGRHRASLETGSAASALGGRVRFLGWLPAGEPVRRELDAADLFVLPSRAEGLPRAMVEAMARGLPCVGSIVGGISELLPPEYLVPQDDPVQLAAVLSRLAADPARLTDASARNLERARQFSASVLAARRAAFYRTARESTERALTRPGSLLPNEAWRGG